MQCVPTAADVVLSNLIPHQKMGEGRAVTLDETCDRIAREEGDREGGRGREQIQR